MQRFTNRQTQPAVAHPADIVDLSTATCNDDMYEIQQILK